MTEHDIPAGYQLQVDTWENDADARQTKVWSGLTTADVYFLIDLVKRFHSRNDHSATQTNGFRGLGNGAVENEQLLGTFFEVLNKHPDISRDMRQLFEDVIPAEVDDEDAAEIIYDILAENLLGYPVEEVYSYDYKNFCRVYDDHRVYFFSSPVVDRTVEFS